MIDSRPTPLVFAVKLALLPVLAGLACNPVDPDAIAGQAGAAAALADTGSPGAAEVTAVSGPGGLLSPGLAEGTLLGKGARLSWGQTIETPKGTLAELAVGQGLRLRLNEDTAIVLPSEAGGDITLTRGEVVALVDAKNATGPARVRAGDDAVRIETGEVQVVHAGANRNVAVVHGRAVLESSGRTVELGAGERVTAPLAPEREATPELSLQPLTDTSWSRTFEQASIMADTVPRGIGSLTARAPGSNNEKQQLVRLTEQRVKVDITGRIAHTEIEQAFFNDRSAVLEGIYRFPLPGDGSISGLSLLVGNRWMDGEIVEKQRARQIFSQIVDATIPRDPALLEWERGNVFKLRVFPIPGNGDRRVRLSYTQVLPVVGDNVRYRFPLGGTGAGGTQIENFSFSVTVDKNEVDAERLAEIETPMLALDRRDSGDRIEFHNESRNFVPTFDLGLDIPVPKSETTVHTSTHLDRDGQAYFMLALEPKVELGKDERPIHYAFVLDRSHSTSPELWTVARGLVEAIAGGMGENDRFTVLACDAACDETPGGLQPPAAASIESVRRFLEDQDLAGASDLGGMVIEAADALERGAAPDGARRVVVYLGDGAPSSGELAPDKLATLVKQSVPDVRVQAIALGSRSDLVALGAVVDATGGDIVQADARDNLDELVRELRVRAAVPVMKNVRVEVPDGMVSVHHSHGGGLRPGENVTVTGKLAHPVKGDVVVRADGPSGPIEARFPVDVTAKRDGSAPAQNAHLPRTWAAMEIADLTRAKGFDAQADIIALSKDYTVLSRFTALLVLENDAMYREFNVVRSAKNTDRWNGVVESKPTEASPPEPVTDASSSTAVPGGIAGGVPLGKSGGEATVTDKSQKRFDAPSPDPAKPSAAPNAAIDAELGGADRAREKRDQAPDFPAAPPPAEPKEESLDFFEAEEGEAEKDARKSAPADDDDPLRGIGGDDGDLGTRGSGSSGKFTPPPPAKKPSTSTPSAREDELERRGAKSKRADGGWGGGFGRVRPVPRLRIQQVAGPSGKSLAQIEALRRAVAVDPSRRSSHGALVRGALRVGHADALAFARQWAESDPDHAPALLALADVLAAQGDPLALRAYASALEVRPFSKSEHDALARGFANKGDLRRACSHRRAIVSIDPSDAKHFAALATCLHRAGRTTEGREVLRSAHGRAKVQLAALSAAELELARPIPTTSAALVGKGELKATLSWTGEDDLDVAIVDAGGQRLSALHPLKLEVREGGGFEELAMRKVKKSVFVEITRSGASEGAAPVRAMLELRTPSGKKSIPVVLDRGSVRVAKVFWSI
jgi:tetratricopeptide (TPR) repeat protein